MGTPQAQTSGGRKVLRDARGHNHYDTFLLSGVSCHGPRSFYPPPKAKNSCNSCHMPLEPSNDFGSRDFDGSGTRKVHDHFFPGANTGLTWLLSLMPEHAEELRRAAGKNADFLRGTDPDGKDRSLRNDNQLRHHWIRLRPDGDGVHSNRSAIGARIVLETPNGEQRREITAARGYLSQSELTATFGLGKTDRIEKVTIHWPGKDAGTTAIKTPPIDQELAVKQNVK